MNHISRKLKVSERRACRRQSRSTQRYAPKTADDEAALAQRTVELASAYGHYGHRQVAYLLEREGWLVGKDRVERIWRQEGPKVPQK